MTREQMTAVLVECWLADLSIDDLEEIARDAIEARYATNYSDEQLAEEYAEMIGTDTEQTT